ncbi:MAG: hypothetical protein ACI9QD_000925 [Thermoproteota archaeon]|jgi:hypothetical protein
MYNKLFSNLKSKFSLTLALTMSLSLMTGSLMAQDRHEYVDVKVTGTYNFKACQDAGYLDAAYDRENEWRLQLVQSDENVSSLIYLKHDKRLDKLTSNLKINTTIKMHADINYNLNLLEYDYYSGNDIYNLIEFTPGYLVDQDMNNIYDETISHYHFNILKSGKDGSKTKPCIDLKFLVKKAK